MATSIGNLLDDRPFRNHYDLYTIASYLDTMTSSDTVPTRVTTKAGAHGSWVQAPRLVPLHTRQNAVLSDTLQVEAPPRAEA